MTTSIMESATAAAVEAAAAARGEPGWLRERRAEAARAFEATPLPTTRLRPWRYTDVTALDLGSFATAAPGVTITGAGPQGGPQRGYAGPLGGALADHEAVVREHLGSVIPGTEGKFQAANAALWEQGALVYAPRSAVAAEPVRITIDAPADDHAMIFPRLLLVAEERGELTVVLTLRSGGTPLLVGTTIEIIAGQASRIRLLIDDRWGTQTQDFTFVRSRVGRDAEVQIASLAIGGRLVKQTIESLIEGPGGSSVIRAVALGDADQHFDFVTLQDHIADHTVSEVEVKAALAGASRSVYYGVTRVGTEADGASAEQENRNLLLSDRAKADSDPVLEIMTADVVRCGHGATVGPVDPNALFYLQSRGLDRRQALQLLVSGFFQSAVAGMPLAGLEEELNDTVMAKLATADL